MPSGKVKFFSLEKGYGFIAVEHEGDVFVHISSLRDSGIESLQTGDAVTFDIGHRNGKSHAVNISLSGEYRDGWSDHNVPANMGRGFL